MLLVKVMTLANPIASKYIPVSHTETGHLSGLSQPWKPNEKIIM